MKLTEVGLKDVLSHEKSHVEMANNLTVFTGVSDSGKSTFLRGLRFALLNKPDGIDLLRHGTKRGECSEVSVGVTDSAGTPHTVLRRRGKSRNEYEVDDSMLKAFGLGVPEEVSRLTELSEHAFQLQSDGHFLLSETDGEIARVLGRTVGLDQIDAAFAEVRKIKTENDAALRHAQADVQREQDQADKFAGIEVVQRLVGVVTELQAQVGQMVEKCAEMENLLRKLQSLPQDSAECVDRVVQAVQCAVSLEKTLHDIEETRNATQSLYGRFTAIPKPAYVGGADRGIEAVTELFDNTSRLQTQVDGMKQLVSVMTRLPAVVAADDISDMNGRINLAVGLHEKGTGLQEGRALLEKADKDLARILLLCATSAADERKAVEEYEQFKQATPYCPECGSEQQYWAKEETV